MDTWALDIGKNTQNVTSPIVPLLVERIVNQTGHSSSSSRTMDQECSVNLKNNIEISVFKLRI